MMSALKKNSRPFRILIVGVCRYPVYHSAPLELGDIAMGKTLFLPNLSPLCTIALKLLLLAYTDGLQVFEKSCLER